METLHSDNEHDTSKNFSTTERETPNEQRHHFINDINFKRLRQLQQEIYAQTEMTPSLRKLINDLITTENLNALKAKLLKETNT